MKIDIVIVTFNNQNEITDCLSNIINIDNINIYIIDNNSNDNTLNILSNIFAKNLKVISLKSNVGLSEGNNIGASYGNAESILFLNPDTVINSSAIYYMAEELKGKGEIGAISPLELDEYMIPRVSYHKYWNLFHPIVWRCLPYRIPRYLWDKLSSFKSGQVSVVSGACIMVRRVVFDQISGYDRKYFLTISDVVDLCNRIRKIGYEIYFTKNINFIHLGGRSNSSVKYITVANGFYGDLYYFRKNKKYIQFIVILTFFSISLVIKSFIKILFFKFQDSIIYFKTLILINIANYNDLEDHPHNILK